MDEPNPTQVPAGTPEGIRDRFLDEEMKSSYLTYAMSVIIARALPDVRDGLKPSQRRVLLAMHDLNLSPRAKHRKCAKITGDTSGNYHPHGDSVVYPTLVRMGQAFNLRYPLVDPQGNFGAIDGSPAAAQRYTEARMSQAAVDLLEDIDKDTVDLGRNYDDTRDEALVLPGRFPNLICNGSQGIAVGMTTSIPPHNVTEVCDALVALIRNPQLGLQELMEFVKGPDFPTGGVICGKEGIVRAYMTGRGHIVVRARARIEQRAKEREQIVVTEIPYQVNPNSIFEKVRELIAEKVIEGLAYVNDETDRIEGLRLVFEVKKGFQADVVLNQLYKFTPLQTTISIILLALAEGRPRTFSLKDLLSHYRDHRIDVIRRRTRFLKRKAEERLHIILGLLIAIADIDEVIRIIRSAASTEAARESLVSRFLLTERQAEAILQMRLARLTGLEVEKLRAEEAAVREEIAGYARILGDISEVHKILIDELTAIRARYGDARRTEITGEDVEIEDEALIPPGPTLVTWSHQGYVKRMSPELYRTQGRGGVGITGADTKEGDFIERLILADNHDYFLLFTNFGVVHWLKVWRIPELGRTSQGRFIENLVQLREEGGEGGRGKEQIVAIIPVREFDDRFLVTISRNGQIKKTPLSEYGRPRAGGIIGVGLKPDDQLVRVLLTDGRKDLLVSTSQGQTIRFSEEEVRPMGRAAAGVIAVKFKESKTGDHVVDMAVADDQATLLSVGANGYGMRTPVSEYPVKGRGGQGVVNLRGLERNGEVVVCRVTGEADDLILISEQGMIVRMPMADIRPQGRGGQGVRVMRLKEGDRVISGVVIPPGEEPGEGDRPVPARPVEAAPDDAESGGSPSDPGMNGNGEAPPAEETPRSPED